MLLQKSFIIILVIYITSTASRPTEGPKRQREMKRRSAKPKMKGKKNVHPIVCMDGFCDYDPKYPQAQINKLLKEQNLPKVNFFLRQSEDLIPRERSLGVAESLCEVASRTIRPRTVKRNGQKNKEYIVQGDNAEQSVYMEQCRSEEPRLNLDCLPYGYSAIKCVQQYREIPLLRFDEKTKIIQSSSYKVPSGCSVEYTRFKVTPVPF